MIRLLTLLSLCISSYSFAQSNILKYTEESRAVLLTDKKTEYKRSVVSAAPGFVALSNAGESVSGFEGSVIYEYGFKTKWALSGELRQAVNIAGFGNLYTQIGAGISYAWTGSLLRKKETVSAQGSTILTGSPYISSAFVTTGSAKQYFFSTTSTIVPLSGLGLSSYYRFGSSQPLSLHVGFSMDFVTNGSLTITPMKIFVGSTFWL